ncbi:uncharacterized protein LOC133818899 [Humulus lupulus]|uniref:uncharacterized protein LOC133818899 n=1 Tax=Humulus lupulus TaxID=3486 RepID=UPI002B40108C|nr:uncharacterized protein LOC133818899 [Humulus lupulus]
MKVLYEIHEGECGNHTDGQSTAKKAMRQRYYWPTMEKEPTTSKEGGLFKDYCKENGIRWSFSAVVHPQVNGQVEAINKVLKKNLKTKLERLKGAWVDELPNVLWAYRTTPRSTTHFALVYGCKAVLPVGMKISSFRVQVYKDQASHMEMAENLDLLEERRDRAQLRLSTYQQ